MEKLSSGFLKQYSYFSGLSDGALEELACRLETVAVPAGASIIEQGTPPDAFYFVYSGEMEITKRTGFGQAAKISVIGSGQGFGEVALLTCSHRSCSVTAKSDAVIFRLPKSDFEDIILTDSVFTSMLVRRIQGFSEYNRMKAYQPFALLEPEKMIMLTATLVEKKFTAGSNIITQGEQGDYYYIIRSGSVGVLVRKGDQAPVSVAILNAGESFGEEALIRDHRRNATVQALVDTTVLALSKTDFDRILRSSFLEFVFAEDLLAAHAETNNNQVFLDARIPAEYVEEHIERAVNIPLEILRRKYQELDPKKEYFTYCTNDSRGMAAAFLLRSQGFNARNIRGGLSAWAGPVSTGSEGIHMPNLTAPGMPLD